MLFRRGETFNSVSLGMNQLGPNTIGAFGAGAAPIVRWGSESLLKLSGITSSQSDL